MCQFFFKIGLSELLGFLDMCTFVRERWHKFSDVSVFCHIVGEHNLALVWNYA